MSAGRGLLYRAIGALMPSPGAMSPLEARSVLILRHDRVGDMLMTLGLIDALHEARPEMRIGIAASAANAAVIEGHPAITSVHRVREGVASFAAARRSFAGARYDAVIDALALKKRVNSGTALLMLASGAKVRVGIGGRAGDSLYTHPVRPARADAHHVEYLAALAEPFGVQLARETWIPRLFVTEAERARAEAFWNSVSGTGARLLVNVSTGKPWTRWLDERTIAVVRQARVAHPDLRIAVTSAPDEKGSARAVANTVDGVAVADSLGGGLRDALAVVATADVVFTPDTSIAHAAAASGRTILGIYPRRTSPQFEPYRARCETIYSPEASLESLEVQPVAAALERLLSRVARP